MGVVYQARDARVGRQVALKVRQSSSHGARERFIREGQVTAQITHPNVLKIHEAFTHAGCDVLVSELIPAAEPLDAAWRGLSISGRVELIAQVARGVAAAHALGVVHRDLKPENLLVSDGLVRVADFGLAYVESAEQLTRTGIMVGTPAFMAPEQIMGKAKKAMPTCDVWSLGVILYLALTDELPFAGDTLLALTAQITTGASREQRAALSRAPRDLEELTLRCLRTAPQERPPNAEEVLACLEAWIAAGGPESPRRRARWLPAALGALVSLAALGLAPTTLEPESSQPTASTPSPSASPLYDLAQPSLLLRREAAIDLLRERPNDPRASRAQRILARPHAVRLASFRGPQSGHTWVHFLDSDFSFTALVALHEWDATGQVVSWNPGRERSSQVNVEVRPTTPTYLPPPFLARGDDLASLLEEARPRGAQTPSQRKGLALVGKEGKIRWLAVGQDSEAQRRHRRSESYLGLGGEDWVLAAESRLHFRTAAGLRTLDIGGPAEGGPVVVTGLAHHEDRLAVATHNSDDTPERVERTERVERVRIFDMKTLAPVSLESEFRWRVVALAWNAAGTLLAVADLESIALFTAKGRHVLTIEQRSPLTATRRTLGLRWIHGSLVEVSLDRTDQTGCLVAHSTDPEQPGELWSLRVERLTNLEIGIGGPGNRYYYYLRRGRIHIHPLPSFERKQ